MVTKPFESRIQDLVYNVDVGIGLRLIQVSLYLLFVLITMLLYTATQFRGLKEADAMDCAQVGRNLALRGRFVTQVVRPASLWFLARKNPTAGLKIDPHPDLLHAPLWPALLAAGFKLSRVSFVMDKPGFAVFPPEQWIVVPLGHLFTLLTGLVLYLFGQRLFERRVALLGTTIYFLSDTVWRNSISGLGLAPLMFFTVTAFWLAYLAAVGQVEDRLGKRGLVLLALSAGCCILAFLTRYAAGVLVPALGLFIGVSFKKKGWVWASVFMVAVLVGIAPWWVRNMRVCGSPLGLAPYLALNDTAGFAGNLFERTLQPTLAAGKVARDLQLKWLTGLMRFYKQDLWSGGEPVLLALFVSGLLYRFVNTPTHRLRWCMMLAIGLLGVFAALYGPETGRLLTVFWPLMLLYGLALFFLLLDRLQLPARLFELAVRALITLASALPLVFALLPPREGPPYPPYFPPFVTHVSRLLTPEELMCTDMPWATAWYGNRTSLLLPATLDEFYEINDYHRRIYGLYFTTLTRDKPYVRELVTGTERTWFPLLEGRIPSDFPLNQGFPINNLDQLFLTDRIRWSRP